MLSSFFLIKLQKYSVWLSAFPRLWMSVVKCMGRHFNSIVALKQKFIRTKSRQINVFYWRNNLYTVGWI